MDKTAKADFSGITGPTFTIAYKDANGRVYEEVDHLTDGGKEDEGDRDMVAAAGMVELVRAGCMTLSEAGTKIRDAELTSEHIDLGRFNKSSPLMMSWALNSLGQRVLHTHGEGLNDISATAVKIYALRAREPGMMD